MVVVFGVGGEVWRGYNFADRGFVDLGVRNRKLQGAKNLEIKVFPVSPTN